MDFGLNEQQEMLKKTARDFFKTELPKTLVKELAKDPRGFQPEMWKKMADLGWVGLVLPEQYGGSDASFLDLTILLEEMGRACAPGPFLSTVVLGALTVLELGNEEQKKAILPRVCRGEAFLTMAIGEPHAMYRPEAFEVEARHVAQDYTISGTKLFVTDGHVADYFIVAAKTAGGVTLFLVDAKAKGVSSSLLPAMFGERQAEVKFDSVRLTEADILGGLNRGREYLDRVMRRAAVAKCSEVLGGLEYVLEISVQYAKDRVAFGKAIGSYQAIQHHCANMLNDLDSCRCMTRRAAWLVSEDLPCALEVSLAKGLMGQASRRITALGHEIHGAMAFQHDHDMHLFTKQAVVAEASFGNNAYHSEVVAREIGL